MPKYLPSGYSLSGTFTDAPDGFRTGCGEIAFLYLNPVYLGGFPNPLQLFVSPPPTADFGGTQNHTFEPAQLTLTTGKAVEARYFDGMWTEKADGEAAGLHGERIHWDTTNFNALTFPFAQFLIGLRGCRKGKVDRNELIKVASSLS